MTPIDAIAKVVMEGIRSTCEPINFDSHEEKKLREKEKVRSQEIYPFLRPMVGSCLSDKGLDAKGRILRLRACQKETPEESESEQNQGEKINPEVSLVDGLVDMEAE